MNLLDQIENYRRRVLWAHYEAFKCIHHAPTKGTMRERAVSRLIKEEFPSLHISSGIACDEDSDWQSRQLDIIELNANARQGINGVYRISDIRSVCEIKSSANASDFLLSEASAKEIKEHSAEIITRLFSFATAASAEHVISQFGFKKNKEFEGFENYSQSSDKYPSIDCFVSLDAAANIPSPFLIVRDIDSSRMLLRSNSRVVDRFLTLYQSEW